MRKKPVCEMNDKGTILIVDDIPADLELLVDTLTAQGYQVLPAESGELALASVAARPPDLILLDIRLPGLNGFEVCRRLKAQPESRNIPVVFISASGESAGRLEGLKLGAVDYIAKPFEREELLARVQTHLELGRLRVRLEQQRADLRQANDQLQTELAERKRTEGKLRQKEHLLSESQRLGHIGSSFYNMTGPIWWSEEMYRLYGVSPDTFIPSVESMLGLIHPGDRPAMQTWIAACAEGEKPDELEFRINLPDGAIRYIRGHGEAVHDVGNRLSYMAGTGQDITERKEAEATRDRMVAILESTTDLVSISDPAGRSLYLNRAGRVLLGVDLHEDITQTALADFLPNPASHPISTEGIPTAVRQGIWSGETVLLSRRGQEIPVSKVILAHKTPDGKLQVLSTIMRDITERKGMEDKLRQLSRAVEQSPASIIITDAAGTIEYVNPKFIEVTGYALAEVLGKNPRILKSGDKGPESYRELWQTITAGKEWRGEFHNKKKNGELYWESASLSPIRDLAGRITHYVAVKEDITARKQTEAERVQLIQELQAALANVKSLSGLLPICSGCKKIRDDKGYWSQVESYVQMHSEATFTHGLCPDCIKKYYPELGDVRPGDSRKGAS
jgi:PAS domain S-box-containing protein